jgi:CheY-like chemotaxis protein
MNQYSLLVVEDEEGIRELLIDYLSTLDFKVFAAASGKEALSIIATHRDEIRLILSDNMMPGGISGTEMLKEIRGMGIQTPAMLFSAVMPKNISEIQKDLNILKLIYKPVELDQLHREISAALGIPTP